MKQRITIIGVVLALILGATGVGWLYYRANPEAWEALVAELSGEGAPPRPASAQPVRQPSRLTGALQASGIIEAEDVTVAAELGGRIMAITAAEGDAVDVGDDLLQIDARLLEAQRAGAVAHVAQAGAALDAARAQLARAQAGATEEEIAMAEAAVTAARGALAMAEAGLLAAQDGVTAAESGVDIAQSGVAAAQAQLALVRAGPLDEEVAAMADNVAVADAALAQAQASREAALEIPASLVRQAEAQVAAALAEERVLRDQYDALIRQGVAGSPEEQARFALNAAVAAVNAAQAALDELNAGATEAQQRPLDAAVSVAAAQRDATQAQLDLILADVREEQVALVETSVAQAEAAVVQAEAAVDQAESAVVQAEAAVTQAQAGVTQAEAQLAWLKAGLPAEEIAALEAQVGQAEAALAASAASLAALDIQIGQATLTAPVSGLIVERLLQVGELAAPGAPLFTIADLDVVTLKVYVPEASLGQIALGQEVEVTVDAYDEVFAGQVSHIASQAEFTPQTVQTQEERVHMVFAVKVRLDNPGHLLKPGMPADAVFQ